MRHEFRADSLPLAAKEYRRRCSAIAVEFAMALHFSEQYFSRMR